MKYDTEPVEVKTTNISLLPLNWYSEYFLQQYTSKKKETKKTLEIEIKLLCIWDKVTWVMNGPDAQKHNCNNK